MEICPELLKKQRTSCAKDKHLVRYTQAEKQKAVEAMLLHGIPDYKVAAQYGVSRAALYNWKQRLLGRNGVVPMSKKADPVEQSRSKESLEEESADLQQQIHRLRMERDALEKVQIVTVTGRQGRNFGPVRAIMPGQVRTRFPASCRTFAYNEITSLQKRNSLQEVQTWTTNECSPCILPTG